MEKTLQETMDEANDAIDKIMLELEDKLRIMLPDGL